MSTHRRKHHVLRRRPHYAVRASVALVQVQSLSLVLLRTLTGFFNGCQLDVLLKGIFYDNLVQKIY